jgi:hypothetical protein
MHQCVCRILLNWNALTLYFREAAFEDKLLYAIHDVLA